MPCEVVIAASGCVVEFGFARALFDDLLAQEAARWLDDNWEVLRERGASSREQALFDHYCETHLARHGHAFAPNVDPRWECRPSRMARA